MARPKLIVYSKTAVAEDQPEGGACTSMVNLSLLVLGVKNGEESATEQLYKLLSRGTRYYLYRMLGPQDLEDKFHDVFLIVVRSIQSGQIREPDRLMGFVRTIAQRQVAACIENIVKSRKQEADLESEGFTVPARAMTPEKEALVCERAELMRTALRGLSAKDQEILIRFYLNEQTQQQICSEMALTETQFRLLKSRAKAKVGVIGKRLTQRESLTTTNNESSQQSRIAFSFYRRNA